LTLHHAPIEIELGEGTLVIRARGGDRGARAQNPEVTGPPALNAQLQRPERGGAIRAVREGGVDRRPDHDGRAQREQRPVREDQPGGGPHRVDHVGRVVGDRPQNDGQTRRERVVAAVPGRQRTVDRKRAAIVPRLIERDVEDLVARVLAGAVGRVAQLGCCGVGRSPRIGKMAWAVLEGGRVEAGERQPPDCLAQAARLVALGAQSPEAPHVGSECEPGGRERVGCLAQVLRDVGALERDELIGEEHLRPIEAGVAQRAGPASGGDRDRRGRRGRHRL
jgi:hypothetical protein